MPRKILIVLAMLIGCLAAPAPAQQATTRPATQPAQARDTVARRPRATTQDSQDVQPPVVTEHELRLADQVLRYKATAGFIPLKDESDRLRAKVFYIAYDRMLDDEADRRDRPLTFVFNGGPGAASVWLHLGTAGPRRVGVPEDGSIPAPPYHLEENPYSWLDFTDLVFIDPVGTGYSRAEGERAREFYSVSGDIASVADVIRLYLTMNDRWLSPKFIAGESYGTTRAAGLSEYLHDRYGIDASGIVLISTVLNFQTLEFSPGNDSPYPLWLPSYTAVAWYHGKLPPELQQRPLAEVVSRAQEWAMTQYMPALLKGSSLEEQEQNRIAGELARYTGLPMEFARRALLKITPQRFEKSLLASDLKLIGRMDGRIIGHDADPLDDTPDFDPSLSGYVGIFSTCFNHYVQSELEFESDLPYEFLSPNVGPWDFGRRGFLDVSSTLRSAMSKVPAMKVLVCSGYYDLATPFGAADYTINQMPLGQLRDNVSHQYYEGGHMLYLNHPALVKLHEDMRRFYQSALPTIRPGGGR